MLKRFQLMRKRYHGSILLHAYHCSCVVRIQRVSLYVTIADFEQGLNFQVWTSPERKLKLISDVIMIIRLIGIHSRQATVRLNDYVFITSSN